jgi:glucose-6-phosphate dehydrogenase assembly protein OpcA
VTDRLSRVSSPAGIDDDLAVLWRDAGRDGPIARALMANLVVYRDCPTTEHVDLAAPVTHVPVDEVARRHPSRVILLHHGGQPDLCAPVGAMVSILLSGPPNARFGIEQIAVRSACAEASLPSIVRRLSLGDIPTSIWWTEDVSRSTPLEALVTMGRQLLYDSRQWEDVRRGVLALAPVAGHAHAPDLADLNWRRLTPMRQAVMQALAPPLGTIDARATRLRVRHRPRDGALAWLLIGWFCSRLDWPPDADMPATIEEYGDGDEVLSVSIGRHDAAQVTATMSRHRVLVTYEGRTAPFSIATLNESEADGVAAELRNLTYDTALRDALEALTRRFTSSRSL